MNPVVFVGLIAALFAAAGNARQRPQAAIPSGAVVAGIIWFTLGPALLVELVLLVQAIRAGALGDAAAALGMVVATCVFLFPWPITRAIAIPLGLPRLAWVLSRLAFWTWRRDVAGGANVAACWAALRLAKRRGGPDRKLDSKLGDWLERKLAKVPSGDARWKLGGASIVAAGLLADARGDRAQAQRVMASAGELAEATRPRQAIAVAWAWLCAEAAERGAWREVEFLGRTAPVGTRTTKFFGAVGARLTGIAPVPNDLQLEWLWFAAPGRTRLRPLLDRARAAPATAERAERTAAQRPMPDVTQADPLVAAMTLHADVVTRPPSTMTRDQIAAVAQAWDRALGDGDLLARLDARAAALGAHGGACDAEELAEVVRGDLLAVIRGAQLQLSDLGEDSELLGRAARRLHGELLDDLEMATTALDSRVDVERELPPLDEWRAFLGLREQYAEAVALGGLRLRRLAFGNVHGPVCSLAVWLWNERSERALANAMFQWLLAEAVIVDDAEAIRLQQRNVDCGI